MAEAAPDIDNSHNDSERSEQTITPHVDRIIASIFEDLKNNNIDLPMLPNIAAKIHKVVNQPESRARDLAQIIGADPVLSARLIQVANSPMVRAAHKIDNLQTAITRMGTSMVRNIVTSFLVKQLFRTRHKSLRKRLADIWTHSTKVAAISHILAARYTNFQPDELMLAGQLHDIGKLPILSKVRSLPDEGSNAKVLDRVLDKVHPTLGKAILKAWEFPPAVWKVASEHENVQRDSEILDYVDVVVIADLHAHIGTEKGKEHDWNTVPAFKKLKLDPEDSVAILDQAKAEISAIQRVLLS